MAFNGDLIVILIVIFHGIYWDINGDVINGTGTTFFQMVIFLGGWCVYGMVLPTLLYTEVEVEFTSWPFRPTAGPLTPTHVTS